MSFGGGGREGDFHTLRPWQVQSSARPDCSRDWLLYSPISVDTGLPPRTTDAFQAECAFQQYPSYASSSRPGPLQQHTALAMNGLAALPVTGLPAEHSCFIKMPGLWPKFLVAL